jgi:hypothetical protein
VILAVVGTALTLGSLARVAVVARDQLPAPFDLSGYETPNLATILLITEGKNIYSPGVFETGDFVLTMYTPAFHYMMAALPASAANPFLTGRIVAMTFMVLVASLIFLPGRPERPWLLPVLALGCFFSIRPIVANMSHLRHDSMALFLSASSVVLVAGAHCGRGRVAMAAGCGCLAFCTKQTYLTGSVGAFLFLAANDRGKALVFAATSTALLALGALFAQVFWGPGFWFSVFVAPQNPMRLEHFVAIWFSMLRQPTFFFLLITTFFVTLRSLWRERWPALFGSPYPPYLAVTTLVLLATVGKRGSAANYFFELVLACLLWLTYALRDVTWGRLAAAGPSSVLALFCLCEAAELGLAKRDGYAFTTRAMALAAADRLASVRREIGTLGPADARVLNLAKAFRLPVDSSAHRVKDSTYSYISCHSMSVNDPLLYDILWDTGVLPRDRLREPIEAHEFDVILLPTILDDDGRVRLEKGGVLEAVQRCYRLARTGTFRYFVPDHHLTTMGSGPVPSGRGR